MIRFALTHQIKGLFGDITDTFYGLDLELKELLSPFIIQQQRYQRI